MVSTSLFSMVAILPVSVSIWLRLGLKGISFSLKLMCYCARLWIKVIRDLEVGRPNFSILSGTGAYLYCLLNLALDRIIERQTFYQSYSWFELGFLFIYVTR